MSSPEITQYIQTVVDSITGACEYKPCPDKVNNAILLALSCLIEAQSSSFIYAGEICYIDGTEEKIADKYVSSTDLSVVEFRDKETQAVVTPNAFCNNCCT